MKQRLYIDTSVFGGYYDVEFAEITIPLFERLQKGEFILLFSTVRQEEGKWNNINFPYLKD